MDPIEALNPLDGRYCQQTEVLSQFFSERALMEYRVRVESAYLIALSEHEETDVRVFSEEEKVFVKSLAKLSFTDVKLIKAIETKGFKDVKATKHDVKAVEYFVREKLKGTSLNDCVEWVHFGLTSEDVNNIAYGLMLSDGVSNVVMPRIKELSDVLEGLALEYGDVPMLARTHGQPASPTTVGKEFQVFASRIKRQQAQLEMHEVLVKLNGASGNYNAHVAAYPNIDWVGFSKEFIDGFNNERMIKLRPNLVTTQIEPHDTYAELFDVLRRINVIVLDVNQDMWRYVSDDWFRQKVKEGEVGSSTMPHKVNPIDFENSEGNLGIANALLSYFSTKLPVSRLQRDLSDSTVERNFGVALGYCLVGYTSTLKGLEKVAVNKEKIQEELENHPEVIAEALQTILRREGQTASYELLKDLTRGKKVSLQDIHAFVDGLCVSEELKKELKQITPATYVGLAAVLGKRRFEEKKQ